MIRVNAFRNHMRAVDHIKTANRLIDQLHFAEELNHKWLINLTKAKFNVAIAEYLIASEQEEKTDSG